MALFEKRYRFTSNRHSKRGMMAVFFGAVSLLSLFFALAVTINNGEASAERMGGAGLFAALFSMIGVVVGISAMNEDDVFPMLPRVGFAVSIVAFILWIGVVYAGIVGL